MSNRATNKVSFWSWLLLYCGLVVLGLAANYPGRLTLDSYDMLVQFRFPEVLNNWHSPFVTFVWSLLSPVMPQPAGALLIQCALLFPYPAALILDRTHSRILASILTAALIGLVGLLVKDMMFTAFMLCGFGALEYLTGTKRIGAVAITVIAALLIRPTNFVILACLGWVWAFHTYRGWAFAWRAVAIAVISVSMIPLYNVISEDGFKAKDARPDKSLLIFDIAGISTGIHENEFSKLPGWPTNSLPAPWDCYTPRAWDPFAWGDCRTYADQFNAVADRAGKVEIQKLWIETIASHPLAYLKHRAMHGYNLLRHLSPMSEASEPWAANVDGFDMSQLGVYGIDTKNMFLNYRSNILTRPLSVIERVVFNRFTPVLSLLLCGYVLVRQRKLRLDAVNIAVATTGIANFIMLVFLGVASEGRYLLPTVLCGILCLDLCTKLIFGSRFAPGTGINLAATRGQIGDEKPDPGRAV